MAVAEEGFGTADAGARLATPLGAELLGLTDRILGSGPAAQAAVLQALAENPRGRLEAIAAAAQACRRIGAAAVPVPPPAAGRPSVPAAATLTETVAAELAAANATLPARHREILALREHLRLSYAQIASVMGLEPSAVASLLARSRLHLRDQLRGPHPDAEPVCPERERALRVLARRQDSEPLAEVDDRWIFAHLAGCAACDRAHAMMLETSVRYRAWIDTVLS